MDRMQMVIKKHINHWDPMGLLEIGAPNDEYDIEVQMMIERWQSPTDLAQLAKIIQDVFVEMFYEDNEIFSIEKCREIAGKILGEIK